MSIKVLLQQVFKVGHGIVRVPGVTDLMALAAAEPGRGLVSERGIRDNSHYEHAHSDWLDVLRGSDGCWVNEERRPRTRSVNVWAILEDEDENENSDNDSVSSESSVEEPVDEIP